MTHPEASFLENRRARWVIAGLLLVEYGLFRQFLLREIDWAYPFGMDQAYYLTRSYLAYEQILARGMFVGLLDTLRGPLANSFLIHVPASIVFLVLGPSRSSALTVNFLYFAAFQVAFAWTLHWLTKRWAIAFAGLGLLMAVQSPFILLGGMADFRADFGAFCLFGVFMSVVIRSGVFTDRRWSAAAGLAAAALVLHRTLTTVYLAGIAGILLLWCVVGLTRSVPGSARRALSRRQFGGLLAAGLVFATITGPLLWYNRRNIWAYYVLPETGPEKAIRKSVSGIHTLGDVVMFYPEAVFTFHLQARFWIAAMVVVGCLAILRAVPHRRWEPTLLVDRASAVVFAVASLLVPLVVLTLVPIKYVILGSIGVPPILWLLALALEWLCPAGVEKGAARLLGAVSWAVAVTAVVIGLGTHFGEFGTGRVFSPSRADVFQLTQLYETLAEYSAKMSWTAPHLFVDAISDSVYAGIVFPVLYERHRSYLRVISSVEGVWQITDSEALAALDRSDFAVLTLGKVPGHPIYPFDESMDVLRPILRAACNRDFVLLGTYRSFGRELSLYGRPRADWRGTPRTGSAAAASR